MWSVGVILYVLLGGYLPFRHVNERLLRGMIKAGRFKFDPQYWRHVSPQAKDLISKLLSVDPAVRLSATTALDHPWLSLPRASLSSHNLSGSLEKLRVFNAKQKLRRVVKMVIAMKKLAAGGRDEV